MTDAGRGEKGKRVGARRHHAEEAGIAPGGRASRIPWRRLALWVLIFGEAGLLFELWLLEHHDVVWQRVPLALLSAGLVAGAWIIRRPGPAALRVFGWLMAGHVAAGFAGLFLHLRANFEFELEIHPGNSGWPLFWETLSGGVPSLAPGAMLQLGFLGMLVCWRHPAQAQTLKQSSQGDIGDAELD